MKGGANKLRKGIIALCIMSLLLVTTLGVMSAGGPGLLTANLTVNTPVTTNPVGGTIAWNVTYPDEYQAENWTWAKVYAYSSSTANSSAGTLIADKIVNQTALTQNGTAATKNAIEDASDYTLVFAFYNGTANVNTTKTSVKIDNTVPQAPSSISPSDKTLITSATTQTFSSTVTTRNTTTCGYYIARDSGSTTATSGTYSTDSCSFSKTFSTSADNGVWNFYFNASDGLNSSESSHYTLQVEIPGIGGTSGAGGGTTTTTTTTTSGGLIQQSAIDDLKSDVTSGGKSKTVIIWIIVIVVSFVAIVGLYLIIRRLK